MIKLSEFPSYCENCAEIEPEAIFLDITTMADVEPRLITEITCANINKCKRFIEHLRKRVGD